MVLVWRTSVSGCYRRCSSWSRTVPRYSLSTRLLGRLLQCVVVLQSSPKKSGQRHGYCGMVRVHRSYGGMHALSTGGILIIRTSKCQEKLLIIRTFELFKHEPTTQYVCQNAQMVTQSCAMDLRHIFHGY